MGSLLLQFGSMLVKWGGLREGCSRFRRMLWPPRNKTYSQKINPPWPLFLLPDIPAAAHMQPEPASTVQRGKDGHLVLNSGGDFFSNPSGVSSKPVGGSGGARGSVSALPPTAATSSTVAQQKFGGVSMDGMDGVSRRGSA